MVKAGIAWNAKQIAKMAEKGTLTFDNAIQRGFVWDNSRMSLLVDTMIRDYPIPPFYTIKIEHDGNKVYDCIDGKQRSTTICKFRNNTVKIISRRTECSLSDHFLNIFFAEIDYSLTFIEFDSRKIISFEADYL